MDIDRHLNLLPEAGEDLHQPVDREAAEIGFADAGEVGRRDAGHFLGRAHGQLAFIEYADDPRRQQGAQLLPVGIWMLPTETFWPALSRMMSMSSLISASPSAASGVVRSGRFPASGF